MRRRKDPFEKPWVIIAAVVGIVAIIAIALLAFMGGGSSLPSASPGETPATPSGQQTIAVGVAPSVIKTQVPVTIPADGVYVRVSYLGSFSGSYGMEGNMTSTRNSGDRFFVVEDATGAVSATFHKEDSSPRHEIVVEVYQNGVSRMAARNSSPFGEASVTYTV